MGIELEGRVREVMARTCPALGRVPIDLLAAAVVEEVGCPCDDAVIQRALVAIASRNAIALAPAGTSTA